MRLPRLLRHLAACFLTFQSKIIGGVLHDYANGKWEEICKWNTAVEEGEAAQIIANMQMNQRDRIYITLTKGGGFRARLLHRFRFPWKRISPRLLARHLQPGRGADRCQQVLPQGRGQDGIQEAE